MPNWLGDAVMALNVIGGIAKKYPATIIDIAIKETFADLGRLLPQVNKTYPLSDKESKNSFAAIAEEKYDCALILPNSFRSAWELWRKNISRSIGYAGNGRSFILTDAIPRPLKHSLHQTDYFMGIAKEIFPDIEKVRPSIEIPKEANKRATALLADIEGPIVGIGFGASFGSAKMWPAKRFSNLIDQLAKSNKARVVLVGAASDRDVEKEVVKLCAHPPVSLVGATDILTLAAVMQKMSVFITNDTGPMHLAALLDTSTVAIFGPTSKDETAPQNINVTIVYHGADCAPCWKRTCPVDHRCMEGISVEEVFAEVVKAIG